jgi:phage-related baseplate assembly protein
MISFSQLIAPITESSIYETARKAALLVGLDIEGLKPNNVIRTALKSIVPTTIYRACGNVIPQIAAGGFLDFAPEGPWLQACGEQQFGVEIIHETFATTQVLMTNVGDLPGSFASGAVIVKNSVSGATYRCDAFSIGAVGEANSVDVPVDVIATVIGTAGDADVGQIDAVVTTFDGLSVTNPAPARGTDLERREDYIARCRAAPAAASPFGPKAAYEFWARSATRPDGSAIGATRVNVLSDSPYTGIMVYIADRDGPISTDDANTIEKLFLTKVINHGTPYGDTLPATAVLVNVTYAGDALVSTGLTADEIKAMVADALVELFATWPIGGRLGVIFQSAIRTAIQSVRVSVDGPAIFADVQVSDPPTNVSLDVDEVAVLGTVTGTIGFNA